MSKKLTNTFNILFFLYVILIITNWYAIFPWIAKDGIIQGLMGVDIIYEIFIIVMPYFLYKKNIKSLFISAIAFIFWISTSSIYLLADKGLTQTIKILANNINAGFYQLFILRFSTFIVLIISIIGVCFYFYDEYYKKVKNDTKD